MLRETRTGLFVEARGKRIALDPTRKVKADYVFISHAHSDHLPPSVGDATVIASDATVRLARERGLKIDGHTEELPGIELVDTGHILGSRGMLADGVFYYTGDLGGRRRAFMPRARPVSCETLLMESTYGRENFAFPPLATVLTAANRLIAAACESGRPVLVEGYPLGKSQVLTYLLQSWSPLYLYGSVKPFNDIYREFGVELPECHAHLSSPADLRKMAGKPGVLIFPATGFRGEARAEARRLGALTLRFTGWAMDVGRSRGDGHMLPISDHADYQELVSFARDCKPQQVLTTHGSSAELALALRRLGFSAKSLTERQLSLTEYLD
ncbi:MAG: MBL fold metallo-hydrolase [Nitrososphaerota archaeon]|nr:MBL fold metallo-hydrolase [Nitrososphaerota archaeon]MDG6940202.1 MBL fold metallo-hydrolase [Nitrososphaerota archaeon]